MSTLSLSRDTTGCHPAVRPGLDALAAFLAVEGYSSHSTGRIVDHVAREGTLGGLAAAGYLEPADEAEAEAVYVENLRPVPQCGRDWEDESIWLDAETLLEGGRPRPISGGAPIRSGDGSIVDDEEERELRRWYRAHPLAEFNAIRAD